MTSFNNVSNLSVGAHVITASVTDSGNVQATATINIDITQPANTAPVVTITGPVDGSTYTEEDTITFTATVTDAEDDDASLIVQWNSSINNAIGTGTSLPLDTLGLGTHTITASVTDSNTVTDTDTITVTVTEVPNTAPVANNDARTTTENTPITFDPRGNDTDNDSDPLTITGVTQGANGNVTFTNTDVTYTPDTGFTGTDNFTYTIDDGNNGSDIATVTMTVTASGGGGSGPTVIFSDDFETDQGWVVNPDTTDTATAGVWERAQPIATNDNGPKQLSTTVSGVYDLSTGPVNPPGTSGAGANDIDGGLTSIQSPSITLPTLASDEALELSFSYYLSHGSNASGSDYFRVSVKSSGVSALLVYDDKGANGDKDAAWVVRTVDLSSFAVQDITLLFEAADEGGGSLVEAAVDDVKVETVSRANDIFYDDFETDQGWTTDPSSTDTATVGQWERANPETTATNQIVIQLGGTTSGTHNLVTGALAGGNVGTYDIDGGITSVHSPSITLPTLSGTETLELSLSYYFAHNNTASVDDYLRITVMGATNTVILEELGDAATDSGNWEALATNLDSYAGQTITLLIESTDGGTGSISEAAIDDVRIVKTGSVGGGGPQAPTVPGDISGANTSNDGNITLSWSAASGDVTDYKLDRSADGGSSWSNAYTGPNLNHPDTGLNDGVTYLYRVQACNGPTLCSAFTGTHSVTVDIPQAPTVPGDISGANTSNDGNITLSWSAASGDVTDYKLDRSADGGSSWSNAYTGPNLNHPDTGLNDGVTYLYRVQACNGPTLCSAFTATHSVTVSIGPAGLAVQHFQYDALGRLKVFSSDNNAYLDYQYDDSGNRELVRDDESILDPDEDGLINSIDTDDDNDLMTDVCELENGFNQYWPGDADKDEDGDGVSNVDECLAMTDPLDDTSF